MLRTMLSTTVRWCADAPYDASKKLPVSHKRIKHWPPLLQHSRSTRPLLGNLLYQRVCSLQRKMKLQALPVTFSLHHASHHGRLGCCSSMLLAGTQASRRECKCPTYKKSWMAHRHTGLATNNACIICDHLKAIETSRIGCAEMLFWLCLARQIWPAAFEKFPYRGKSAWQGYHLCDSHTCTTPFFCQDLHPCNSHTHWWQSAVLRHV